MSVEVVLILGPGASSLAATLSNAGNSECEFVAHDSVPDQLFADLPAAIILTRQDLEANPLIESIAAMEPVSRRPAIIIAEGAALTQPGAVAPEIEKSWIRHSLRQFDELGGPTFTAEMLELFHGQVDQYLGELETSLQKGDAPTARRIVHTLKSTLANYGGRRLRATAQMLENEASQNNLAVVREHAADFSAGVRQFRDVLHATAAEFSSSPVGR